LLFSEYVEGSSKNKALEIYALEGGSLEACEVRTYFNGNEKPSRFALHGTLARGGLQVLCTKDFAASGRAACDSPENLTFNGDDAVSLSCAGVIQDVIGEIGVDPGDSWGHGATLDHTLRRRCSITEGRAATTRPFDVDAEWLMDDEDSFADLGKRGCEPPDSPGAGGGSG
jgi:uncharacterized protein